MIKKNNIIDKIAYDLYIEQTFIDIRIDKEFVDDINSFISWHNKHENNLGYYYEKANDILLKQRKDKILKLKRIKL